MANKCARLIEVDKLYFAENVRTPECLQLPAMCESLRRHGFKTNHPLVVSEKKIDGETRYHVLVGNRRGLALVFLRDNEPEAYRQALDDAKVPAIVHRGLTEEEEVEHRIDHSFDEDRVPLGVLRLHFADDPGIRNHENIASSLFGKLGAYLAAVALGRYPHIGVKFLVCRCDALHRHRERIGVEYDDPFLLPAAAERRRGGKQQYDD